MGFTLRELKYQTLIYMYEKRWILGEEWKRADVLIGAVLKEA